MPEGGERTVWEGREPPSPSHPSPPAAAAAGSPCALAVHLSELTMGVCSPSLTRLHTSHFKLHTVGLGSDGDFGVLQSMADALPGGVGQFHRSELNLSELKGTSNGHPTPTPTPTPTLALALALALTLALTLSLALTPPLTLTPHPHPSPSPPPSPSPSPLTQARSRPSPPRSHRPA